MAYYFDSYALIEILRNNPAFSRFGEERVITSQANLAEVLYYALRTGNEGVYAAMLRKWRPELITPALADWESAARARFDNRKKNMSYVDCLSYALAEKHGLTFFTGGAAFKGMRNVEHVK